MPLPQLLVTAAELYLAVGLAIAVVFSAWLVHRLEPSARGGSPLFRILILPAATLLWPVIVARTARAFRRRTP